MPWTLLALSDVYQALHSVISWFLKIYYRILLFAPGESSSIWSAVGISIITTSSSALASYSSLFSFSRNAFIRLCLSFKNSSIKVPLVVCELSLENPVAPLLRCVVEPNPLRLFLDCLLRGSPLSIDGVYFIVDESFVLATIVLQGSNASVAFWSWSWSRWFGTD